MAKVKQVYGETRFVPWLGREVEHGEVVDVPGDDLPGYLEAGWEPADKPTAVEHQKLLADRKVTVGGLTAARKPEVKES